MHTAPKAPFTEFFEAVKASRHMRGIRVLAGARALPFEGTPPRVVLVPTPDSAFDQAENDELADVIISVKAHCWGQDHDRLWAVICALTNAVSRYRIDTDTDARRGDNVEFDEDPDTNRDGEAAVLEFLLRGHIEEIDLDGGEGQVDAIRYEPGDGTTGPTVNQTS